MAENVVKGLEAIFFTHILANHEQFLKVDTDFFKDSDINFIYNILRTEYIVSKNKKKFTNEQIVAMVAINDPDKKISKEFIKMLLKTDNSTYEKDWLLSRFKAWKMSNMARHNINKSIDYIRGLDEIDIDTVPDVVGKIKTLFSDINFIEDDDEDLGQDFDDIESHQITSSNKKISTGWSCVDTIMDGGWDQASLNCIMGQTNGGKCSHPETIITVRNKKTGIVERISMIDFFERF